MKPRQGYIILLIWLIAKSALAAEVTLVWDPNKESDMAGYKLYYRPAGKSSYDFSNPIAVIPAGREKAKVDIPKEGFFVIKAFDNSGNMSAPSKEIHVALPDTPRPKVSKSRGDGKEESEAKSPATGAQQGKKKIEPTRRVGPSYLKSDSKTR